MAKQSERCRMVKALPQLPGRPRESHKGMFGRVLAVGGSMAMPGSVSLVSNAAYRSGAGLVRIFCPAGAQPMAMVLSPCATSCPARQGPAGEFSRSAVSQLLAQAREHDVVAMGPGMGESAGCKAVVEAAILRMDKPLVLDASGLTNLAAMGQQVRARGPLILTPHPGEMAKLLAAFRLKVNLTQEESSRKAAARALAELVGCVVVLKGAGTVVTDGQRMYVNTTGNAGLATGGTGDVLTGVIAGLVAQKMAPFEAACLGTYLHGLSGDIGAKQLGEHGLMASDLLDLLPAAFVRYSKR